jgi:hypothetical protein
MSIFDSQIVSAEWEYLKGLLIQAVMFSMSLVCIPTQSDCFITNTINLEAIFSQCDDRISSNRKCSTNCEIPYVEGNAIST